MSKNYTAILLEELRDKFDVLLEVVTGLREQLASKADKSDITSLRSDIRVLRYAVEKSNNTIMVHDQQLAALRNSSSR